MENKKYIKLINEVKNSSLSENEKKLKFINMLEKGERINKSFSQHLDKYINQYKKTGNVGL